MSVSNILIQSGANKGKIDPSYILGGGAGIVDSVTSTAGIFIDNQDQANPIVQIGTNQAGDLIVGTAVQHIGAVLQQGAAGTYLGVDNAGVLGYSVPPTQGIPFTAGGQMLYSGANAPFPDTLLNVGNAGQVLGVNAGVPTWTDTGGSGLITATAPLKEFAVAPASNIAIDFTARGDLVAGLGAPVGGNPVAGTTIPLGAQGAVLTATPNDVGGAGISWIVPQPVTGGQVIRVTTPGVTTISQPLTQNQQVQLIDTASATNTFVYEECAPHPDNTFIPYGSFVNNIGGVFFVVVWGLGDSGRLGEVWTYEPNILVPKNGIWTIRLETNPAGGENITTGCLTNPNPQTFGSYDACDMAFGGSFAQIIYYIPGTPPTPVTLTGLNNIVYWSPSIPVPANQIVNPNFSSYLIPKWDPTYRLVGVARNANANAIKCILFKSASDPSFPITTPSGSQDYKGMVLIGSAPTNPTFVPLQGGATFPVVNGWGAPPSAFQGASIITSVNWDFNGNMNVCGAFSSVTINGAPVVYAGGGGTPVYFWVSLTYDPTPASLNGFIIDTPPYIQLNENYPPPYQITNVYDPSVGICLCGGPPGDGGWSGGGVNGIAIFSLTNVVTPCEYQNVDLEIGLLIDAGAYVTVDGFNSNILGIDNGYSTNFGNYQTTLDWFIPKIASGYPLAFIGIAPSQKQLYQGYFKVVAGQTRINFTPAKLRYALPSGTTGLATFANLNSTYSSITFLGDLTGGGVGEWDCVGFTGNITFS